MARRPVQPVDQQAADAADEELYSRHEDDRRPNALYDADGNRQPMDPNSPSQSTLRREWLAIYEENGGEVESPPPADREPDDTTEPCPYAQGETFDLMVDFHYLLHEPATDDDTATLSTDDDESPAYEQTHNLQDSAHVEEIEHNYLRMTFTDAYRNRRYKLQIDPGSGPDGEQMEPYYVFRSVLLPKSSSLPMPSEDADETMDGQLEWQEGLLDDESDFGEQDAYGLYSDELHASPEEVDEAEAEAEREAEGEATAGEDTAEEATDDEADEETDEAEEP